MHHMQHKENSHLACGQSAGAGCWVEGIDVEYQLLQRRKALITLRAPLRHRPSALLLLLLLWLLCLRQSHNLSGPTSLAYGAVFCTHAATWGSAGKVGDHACMTDGLGCTPVGSNRRSAAVAAALLAGAAACRMGAAAAAGCLARSPEAGLLLAAPAAWAGLLCMPAAPPACAALTLLLLLLPRPRRPRITVARGVV